MFNALDATFTVAHYYTYFDLPTAQLFSSPGGIRVAFDDGLPCANDPTDHTCGAFYKHILNAGGTRVFNVGRFGARVPNPDREILPIIVDLNPLPGITLPLEPIYLTQPADSYLNTFFVGTSYRSGQISPGLTVFYDWGGAWLVQPLIAFSRDPFRFSIDYSRIDAATLKAGSGVSLLRDRDNVQFKLEYVL